MRKDDAMHFVLQLIFAGVCVGAVYALIAMGLSLTFWTTRTLNFGQGSLLMTASVATVAMLGAGMPAVLAVPLGILLAGGLMVVAERIAIRPLLKSGDSMGWVVSTLGLGIFLQGFVSSVFGSQAIAFPSLVFDSLDSVDVAGVQVSSQYLAVLALSLTLMVAMELFLRRSAWGRAVRAVSHDADAAALAGIPVRRVIVLSFVASGVLAGIAGVMVAQITGTVDPSFGFNLMVLGFVAAVFGGMGNTAGALVGGIALGVIEKLVGGYVSTAAEHGMAFAILMVILAIRPQGLFGRKEFTKV
ncbi:branched-chain amino acid ABC transporter permease [Azospirillum formosense]|uniref:branched-chain amino acid ABC transporter permease n=1 Tax=Azospirillum formosense TaxID=861533 RepID=UPI001FE69A31|nr:branched-chain amino acid ABC transporter permease [Azospirillum formosense]